VITYKILNSLTLDDYIIDLDEILSNLWISRQWIVVGKHINAPQKPRYCHYIPKHQSNIYSCFYINLLK